MPNFPNPWPPRMPVALGERSGFPSLEARAYLAHCAISPAFAVIQAAATEVIQDYARRGVGAFVTWHERREGLRAVLAELIHADPSELGLVANTTTGVSTIALSLPWRAGETMLLLRGEFPTNVTPWQRAAELFDLRVEFLEVEDFARSSGEGLAKLEARLERGGVRLLASSAVQFQTGLRMPLAAMAELVHAHGAELFCDASQAVGGLDFDVGEAGVDYVAAGSHKWLMGLEVPAQRSGIVAVRPPAVHTLAQIYEGLTARGVVTTIPDGLLRFAPHWPNALGEVEEVLGRVDEILR